MISRLVFLLTAILLRGTAQCKQTTPQHPSLTKGLLWFNNRCKPMHVELRPATPYSSAVRREGTSSVGSAGVACEIQKLCEQGLLDRALDVLFRDEAVHSVNVLRYLLKVCSKRKARTQALRLHSYLAEHRLETSRFLGEYVVSTLVTCGAVEDAVQVFHRLPNRTVFSWTALISGYLTAGQSKEAIRMFQIMQDEGLEPNSYTFVSLLQACGSMSNLDEGKMIHAQALRLRLESDMFVGTALVDMYGKCGSIAGAQNVFDSLPTRNVASWTAMLSAYTQHDQPDKALQLYEQMQIEGVSPNDRTFVTALQACGMLGEKDRDAVNGVVKQEKCLEKGKAIHADVNRRGYDSDVFVSSTLVSMYGKCGSIVDAQYVFDGMCERNVVAWNGMIALCAQRGHAEKALQLYEEMRQEGVSPTTRTFVSLLQACSILADKEAYDLVDNRPMKVDACGKGREIHVDVWRKGSISNVFVGSTLVSMYGRCGSTVDAQHVFDDHLCQQNVVAWNAMLVAYAQEGRADKVLQLYEEMQERWVSPDDVTLLSVLQASGILAEVEEEVAVNGRYVKVRALERGKAVHADALRKGYGSHVLISNTLISTYGKCWSIVDAQTVFDRLSHRSVVSWTAILSAYARQHLGGKTVELYRQMEEEGVRPDEVTLLCILQACSDAGGLNFCRQIHQSLLSMENALNPSLITVLIHAYGRCASMVDAQTLFDTLPHPDVVSWTTLIAGYARQGNYRSSLSCYEGMQQAGVQPDGVTFLSLFSVCSHAGLVDQGVTYLESMSKHHGLTPEIEHYASVVDLLGRAGWFTIVEELLSTMPIQPNLAVWLCLLGACRKHGRVVLGKHAFDCAVALEPKDASAYVLMWNIYADACLWDCAMDVEKQRQQQGAWKKPGQSWTEDHHEVHAFVVKDCKHREQEHLYGLLGNVRLKLDEHIAGEPGTVQCRLHCCPNQQGDTQKTI